MIDGIRENIVIRRAVDNDSKRIRDLIFNIWLNEYQFDVREQDFPDLEKIDKYYFQEDGLFLIAMLHDQIIGTIACNRLNKESFVLKRMFVEQKYRDLGIAKSLIAKLFKEIKLLNKGKDVSYYLSTKESEAIAAKNFYLKNGFRVISKSELPDGFPFFYEDDLFMMKDK